jgi:hypothetical protein
MMLLMIPQVLGLSTDIGFPTTAFVEAFITETVLSPVLLTYISLFFVLYAIPTGVRPTGIGFPTTAFVEAFITEVLLSGELVTYISLFFVLYAIPRGTIPTSIGFPTTVFVEAFIAGRPLSSIRSRRE